MSIVVNMKKSIHECMPKRDAVIEGSRSVMAFLNQVPAYRRPGTGISEFLTHGAGAEGVFVSYNKATRQITSVALALHQPWTRLPI